MARERNTQRKADEIITAKVDTELKAALATVYALIENKDCDEDELMEAVINANEWISFTAGELDGLYDVYSFRLYKFENKIFIAQGNELDVHPEGRKDVY